MIKVTFQTENYGLYWAVCKRIALCDGARAYFLDSVMEDSEGRGPLAWTKTTIGWRIVTVEEV